MREGRRGFAEDVRGVAGDVRGAWARPVTATTPPPPLSTERSRVKGTAPTTSPALPPQRAGGGAPADQGIATH
ncbi:Kinesin-like protein KIN-14L [Frankliniella fusca]|uniref:Kinesin-like protein KIN-14L n=1 Tax=Frankliniella fusca TaxID=407009 RepID=A0AAE1LKT8_9NEOP|nr:Kinesin-like protein KIN-14L [Frankliniella fusca]